MTVSTLLPQDHAVHSEEVVVFPSTPNVQEIYSRELLGNSLAEKIESLLTSPFSQVVNNIHTWRTLYYNRKNIVGFFSLINENADVRVGGDDLDQL